jgi:hypothetical protein
VKRSTSAGAVAVVALLADHALGCAGASPSVVEAPMTTSDGKDGGAALAIVPASEPSFVPRSPDFPFARGDHWKGTYFCAQGRTNLELSVEDVEDDAFEVVFAFSVPTAQRLPITGSFRMQGSWDAKERRLQLKAERWLDQPPGYEMVDLVGKVSRVGVIDGTVAGPGCTTFSVRPDPPRKSFP